MKKIDGKEDKTQSYETAFMVGQGMAVVVGNESILSQLQSDLYLRELDPHLTNNKNIYTKDPASFSLYRF